MNIQRCWRTACGAVLLSTLITARLCGQEAAENTRTILKKEQPRYPALAQKMNVRGVVKLEVLVAQDGSVKSMSAKGGHPLLVDAAQEAIKHWKWQPEAHQTMETIEIRFFPN